MIHGSWLIAVDQKIYAFAVKSRLKPTRPTSLSGDPTTVQIWNLDFDYYRFDVVSKSLRMLCVLICLLYTSPSPRDGLLSRMPSSA